MLRGALSFLGGAVLGVCMTFAIADVKYPVYHPYYLEGVQ